MSGWLNEQAPNWSCWRSTCMRTMAMAKNSLSRSSSSSSSFSLSVFGKRENWIKNGNPESEWCRAIDLLLQCNIYSFSTTKQPKPGSPLTQLRRKMKEEKSMEEEMICLYFTLSLSLKREEEREKGNCNYSPFFCFWFTVRCCLAGRGANLICVLYNFMNFSGPSPTLDLSTLFYIFFSNYFLG